MTFYDLTIAVREFCCAHPFACVPLFAIALVMFGEAYHAARSR